MMDGVDFIQREKEKGEEKKKIALMDIIIERLDRHLSGLKQGKGDPTRESGFGLGGLRKLIVTWEVHYSDKDFEQVLEMRDALSFQVLPS